MDWKLILAEFLASLVARIAPALIEVIGKWLESLSDDDKIAMVTEISKAMKARIA